MIDRKFADRRFPVRHTSSIALFYYEPELDDREDSETRVTYFKVVCTITGLNLDADKASDELFLGLEEGEVRGNIEVYLKLADLIRNVYPCYGAIVEVAVFPGYGEREDDLDRYPYVSAFEPKQRQVFETVSETGEVASRSGSGTSVTKGGNTTGSTEDLSVRTGNSFQMSGQGQGPLGGGGGSIGQSVTGQWGSVGQSGTQNVNMITTDNSREKRESLSHTTQLAQLYTLLESYHLGTNRALFMLFPRPHIVAPLIAGPRAIEGVQEFFFVVEQPRDAKGLCIDARLETQHVLSRTRTETTGQTKYEKGTIVQAIDETNSDAKIKTYPVSVPGGFVVDRSNGSGYSSAVDVGLTDRAKVSKVDVQDASVTFSVQYSPQFLGTARFVADLSVFYVSAQATESPVTTTVEDASVVLTARTLSGCLSDRDGKWTKFKAGVKNVAAPVSVTFERPVKQEYLSQISVPGWPAEVDASLGQALRMEHANRFGDYLRQAAIASLNSSDRYALGQHSIAETDFVCRVVASDVEGQGYPSEVYQRPARFPDEVLERLSEADRSQVEGLRVADLLSLPTSLLATRLGVSTKAISGIKLMNVGLRAADSSRGEE